ncbi:hypothetical protein M5K25_020183 [Dendrobium thyrsiflorum]|uniref:Secreted protein n=1 Tax=Dendrobium thyrsiflorum TaxID=117978 RepID=A0ABD0UG21_DENTH
MFISSSVLSRTTAATAVIAVVHNLTLPIHIWEIKLSPCATKLDRSVVIGAGSLLCPRRGSRISATHLPHGRCRTPRYLLSFFLLGLLFDCPFRFASATSKKKSQPRQPSMPHSLQLSARGKEIIGAAASGLPEMTWVRASTMMEVSCSAGRRRWVEFFGSM